jgi:beta-glucosidase/6-phospho-beta-glucosidase/beta-galactosidase
MRFDKDSLALGVGIEDTFIPQELLGQRKLDEYELTQHYTYWREDLKLAADAGARYIRWGVPWYMVEPKRDVFDFSWIDQVAELTTQLGLEVIVDLQHYGTPLWLDNSFINPEYAERFAEYAGQVAARYKGIFHYFTTSNEPMTSVVWSGRDRRWPPYLSGEDGLVSVLSAVCEGMIAATKRIKLEQPDAEIVHVDAGFRYAGTVFPRLPKAVLDEWRFVATDLFMGRIGEQGLMFDYLTQHGMSADRIAWFRENGQKVDVMGVNYYPAFSTVSFDEKGNEYPVETGVAGFEDMLRTYWDRYGIPMVVTETSRNESPESKEEWLHQSISALQTLRSEGIDVRGYTWFPFFDLIDWSYRDLAAPVDEYWNPLGIVSLRRDAANQLVRVPTSAVAVYKTYAEQLNK